MREDLRSKISPSKDEALMETDDAEEEDNFKLILHVKKNGAAELGAPFSEQPIQSQHCLLLLYMCTVWEPASAGPIS